jgi:hypothetical protein
MSKANGQDRNLLDALESAHQQLLERDQRIDDLRRENTALRIHLESVLSTRAWKVAERFRRLRSTVASRTH